MSPLVLLLALAPETCAPSDLACVAREKTREAQQATDPQEQAHTRLTAARAHLALYRKQGTRSDLCAARRLLKKLPRRTMDLGELPQKTRAEVEAELAELGYDCSVRRPPRPPATPTAPTPSPQLEPSTSALPTTSDEVGPPIPVETGVSPSDGDALLEVKPPPVRSVAVEGPKASVPSPDPEARTVSPADSDRPILNHPGRGLLIAGGISLGAASVLGGVTTYAAIRVDAAMTQHDGLAAEANSQGYTSPDVGVMRRDLEADAPHWRRVMIGTAITTVVLTGAAVALLTVGAVKRRQSPARLALHPVLPGLLLTARF